MSDIQMMKDQIAGLIGKGKALRDNEAVFLKVQGLNEEIEKANSARELNVKKIEEAKEKKKSLVNQKNLSVSSSTLVMMEKMNEILPIGKAIIDLTIEEHEENDKSVIKQTLTIGWDVEGNGRCTPYNGLSGGQKQVFDTAISHVLNANIIVMEAAELDEDHLLAAMEDLAKVNKQVIVNTCHPVEVVPAPFVKIDLGEVAA